MCRAVIQLHSGIFHGILAEIHSRFLQSTAKLSSEKLCSHNTVRGKDPVVSPLPLPRTFPWLPGTSLDPPLN